MLNDKSYKTTKSHKVSWFKFDIRESIWALLLHRKFNF